MKKVAYTFWIRYAVDTGGQTVLENMKEYLLNTIQCTFEVGQEKSERLYEELIECTRYKHMVFITIYFIKLRNIFWFFKM